MSIEQDNLQRFLFKNIDVQGKIVHLNESYRRIMEQHAYPATIRQHLGETLVVTTLLTSTLKFTGQVTVQLQSEGPINLLVAKCTDALHIRGLAQWDVEALATELHADFSQGTLVITIDPDKQVKRYQSIVPLQGKSVAHALQHYFAQSEQLSTFVWLDANADAAVGLLLQLMPSEDTQASEDTRARETFWEYATKIADSITASELYQLDNRTILRRLYHEHDIILYDAEPVLFRCNCSIESMEDALLTAGLTYVEDMLKAHKKVVVTCEFCANEYVFSAADVARIFGEKKKH